MLFNRNTITIHNYRRKKENAKFSNEIHLTLNISLVSLFVVQREEKKRCHLFQVRVVN